MTTVGQQVLAIAVATFLVFVHGSPGPPESIIGNIPEVGSSRAISGWRDDTENSTDYRLPTNIYPETYEIYLSPYLENSNFTFDGNATIVANVVNATNKIVLHYNDMTVNSVSVTVNSTLVTISSSTYDNTTDKWTIELANELPNGTTVTIISSYLGNLNDEMVGFYRSSYVNAAGETRWLAATQFQATHARQAFPCFDEPAFKARFRIHLRRPENYTSLSNMALESSSAETNGYVWDTFNQSIAMSTYLVAFVVSDFSNITNSNGNFTLWTRPEAISQAEYGLEFGMAVLSHLATTFGLEYQLSKMDMVAVPDFSSGAMENWGLATYRETALLYDEIHSSAIAQQRAASVNAHECTHMWFGNLVSPSWWHVLWLNEAFARYYQYIATAAVETTWNLDQQFVVEQLQVSFATDGLESSTPMTNPVSSPSEIGDNFGTITYAKGGSIVRMMENIFGTNLFLAALHDHLVARQYSTADPEHLWAAIQGQVDNNSFVIGSTVEEIMSSWTEKAGFPVINVTITNNTATLTQERFLLRKTESSVTNLTWWVPITWTTRNNTNFTNTTTRYWFANATATIEISNVTEDWVVFNIQEAGYYRVNYDADSWAKIFSHLNSDNFEDIHELNRAAIVDDLLNLGRGGYLNYTTVFNGLQYLTQETNYLPFKAAFTGLAYLTRRFAGRDGETLYANYMLKLIANMYEKLGFEDQDGDDRLTVLLRNEVLHWACTFGHQDCINKSLEYFANYRANSSNIVPKTIRPAVYCTAIKHGSSEDWWFLWQAYLNASVSAEQTVILTALGCSENTTILHEYLQFAMTDFATSGIRSQDSAAVFATVYGAGLVGAEYVMDFVAENHEAMYEYFHDHSDVAYILADVSLRLSTEELVEKFENVTVALSTNVSSLASTLNSYLTLAKYELNWYNDNSEVIINWLTDADTSATTDYRLPTTIVPEYYEMYITPYIVVDNFTFDGVVHITANVASATNKIVLHTDEIEWDQISVTANSTPIGISSLDYTSTYHFLVINLNSTLSVGSVLNISIVYTGTLNTVMRGFYRSSYFNASGERRWLAATQLEPTAARKLFPCFDEPALKAKFLIHVNRPEDYHTLSNMPLDYSSNATNGRVWDTFQETVTMPTYLVAIIVSDFAGLTNASTNHSVWARPNAIGQAEYALSIMPPLVDYFEDLLDHQYQLPKLDMTALPDFTSGAMENWGLLTYRETRMLIENNRTSAPEKQVIANVISHEITHQWFGNLVSPEWWKYLWLSEGFARYYQYHATSYVETTWGLRSQFVVEQMQVSYATDGLTSTHAMSYDVWNPTQISGIFDTISYAKAASILRMMEKTFGSEIWANAQHDYLEARQYNYATPEHLWDAFQGQVNSSSLQLNASVKTIMDTWVTQAGFPVVNVTITNGVAMLSQQQFLLRNTVGASTEKTWWVPITWTNQNNPSFDNTTPTYWLAEESGTINVNSSSDEWTIFNIQESGYYRVNYDQQSWQRIIAGLKGANFTDIHELNRASILDDLLNLARAGHVDYETVFSATQYLTRETNYIPWRAAFNGLAYLNRRFAGRDVYDLYKTHILTILDTIYNEIGFYDVDGEDYFDTLLRRYVLIWACNFEHEGCIATSQELFAAWKANFTEWIPANQREAVYCTAIKYGSSDDWEFLWQQSQQSNVATEQLEMLAGLGCSQNSTILNRYLEYAITEFAESRIRSQDSTTVFSNVYGAGLFGVEFVLDFVESHMNEMYEYYDGYSSHLTVLSGVALRLSTDELIEKFETFIENNSGNLSSIASSLNSYLALAKYELNWYETNYQTVYNWLSEVYEVNDYRLPTNIKPVTYDIYLKPYIEIDNFTFDGEVSIAMNVINATSKIVLQAAELTIHEILIYRNGNDYLTISSTTYNSITHKLTIILAETLAAGSSLNAHITYTGILNDRMQGFYRSSYVDSNGTTRWLATTQFQPTHARRAFPCFDEPSFKANFTVNIERPNDYHSRSNMPWSHSVASNTSGRTWDTFEQTVTMSSYLIAFLVSDFDSISNDEGNFTVWARSNAVEYGVYGLSIGQQDLSFLTSFTGVAYPLPKMDMAAIPDFSAGAMENWGLVTYREYGLLAHDNVTTVTYKKYLNTVVAHELVHMWFGNLVTCDWWDYTWLNEGFAQYLQWVAGNASEPSWNLLQQFVAYQLQVAMETDGAASIRPMNNNVSSPSEISAGFDTIAYGKSASVIRMMHHSFGEEKFVNALHNYLETNQYGTTVPADLYSALQTQVDADNLDESVATLMGSWTEQAGFPVINATLQSGVLALSQERFVLTRTEGSVVNYTFWIPITYTTASSPDFQNTSPKFWFGNSSMTVDLGIGDEWFILNIQQVGYYRVNYDENSWQRIIAVLRNSNSYETIHEMNRAEIIDDLLNLARSGYIDYSLALDATLYLKHENNHLPFKALFNGLTFLYRRFRGQSIEDRFNEYILSVIDYTYETTGLSAVEGEGQLVELNRQLIVQGACNYGHAGCIEQSLRLFAAWRADSSQWITPNIRTGVYCTAIRYGSYEDWQFLWNHYLATNFGSDQVVILTALGCTTNTTTLTSYLLSAISSEQLIRRQDVSTAFSSVYDSSDVGLEHFFSFLTTEYNALYEYYSSWSSVLTLFSAVATRLSTQTQIDTYEAFITANPNLVATNLTSLASYLTAAKTNLAWYEEYSPGIITWLEETYGDTDDTNPQPTTELATTENPGSGTKLSSVNLILMSLLTFIASVFH